MFVTGLVLAAGASVRLGEAKQLLPYRGRTLVRSEPNRNMDRAMTRNRASVFGPRAFAAAARSRP